jgi:hypothetical protein
MAPKKRNVRGKAKKKARRKVRPAKPAKAQADPKKPDYRRAETTIPIQPLARVEHFFKENVRITVENIRGETAIGDLLVAFPRTREVLVRNGLRLEAEDAGDIYMTLDAFSALNGLKTDSLVRDLVDIAREPPPQVPGPQLVAPPPL